MIHAIVGLVLISGSNPCEEVSLLLGLNWTRGICEKYTVGTSESDLPTPKTHTGIVCRPLIMDFSSKS